LERNIANILVDAVDILILLCDLAPPTANQPPRVEEVTLIRNRPRQQKTISLKALDFLSQIKGLPTTLLYYFSIYLPLQAGMA
jgi:hypothetical protein